MIGISFLFGIGLWLILAILLSQRIPRWLGVSKHTTIASVLLFPLVLMAPIADDLIGRWQFYRLCERESVVTLSPDWMRVKRAREGGGPITELKGYAIPIKAQHGEFLDADTGRPFLSYQSFHTKGGFLLGQLGLGLGQTASCWPADLTRVMNEVNTDSLIKQGDQN